MFIYIPFFRPSSFSCLISILFYADVQVRGKHRWGKYHPGDPLFVLEIPQSQSWQELGAP